jgi:hypothetical protein
MTPDEAAGKSPDEAAAKKNAYYSNSRVRLAK